MRLKTLNVQGFKSFPKETTLQFSSPISAIVGPNGSGKSNIAEAFRFVLGEQSMKSMRGKRGEDLIFGGSVAHNRLNRAYVRLELDNRDRVLDIDFDEVRLERAVHRDGANEYFINGSPARLKDIRDLISGAHIGSSGHHIISQGEADKVIEVAPPDRKKLIEEALGLQVYQNKRRESIRKLEKTYENLKEVETQRREVSPRINYLKQQKKKIERVRDMLDELTRTALDYVARESRRIDHERQSVEKKRSPLDDKRNTLETEIEKYRTIIERDEKTDSEEERQELLSVSDRISELNKERDQYNREIGRIEGEIASQERVIRESGEKEESNAKRKVYLHHVEDTARYIEDEIAKAESEGTIERMRDALTNIGESIRNFIRLNKEETDDAAVKDARAEIGRLEQEKQEKETERQKVDVMKREQEEAYRAITNKRQQRKDTSHEAERSMYELQNELNTITFEIEKLDARQRSLENQQETLDHDLVMLGKVVGRAVLDHKQHVIVDEHGDAVSDDAVLNEDQHSQDERKRAVERLMMRVEDNTVQNSDEVIREFNELVEKDEFLERELTDLKESISSLERVIADLEETLEQKFTEGLRDINRHFQQLFSHMFGGGTARLSRVSVEKQEEEKEEVGEKEEIFQEDLSADEKNEKTEGVELYVNPPRKKIKGLQMLSGGERSLVSIALLFAMSSVNPPPFIILDETDAALDESNAKRYGDLIEELSDRSQLIVITHNRETMSRAGILYGVTMGTTGASSILSVAFDEAEETLAR